MKSRIFAAVACAVMVLGVAGGAQAQIRLDRPAGGGGSGGMGGGGGSGGGGQQTSMIDKITPEVGARLLQSVGYKGGEVLRFNNAQMQGVKMDLNGNPVAVVFTNCEGGGCNSYFFLMDFGKQNISADFINKFNSNNRFARIYLGNNGNAILQLDGHTFGGVSPGNFVLNGALFANAFKNLMSN
jgi:hypothetical protein